MLVEHVVGQERLGILVQLDVDLPEGVVRDGLVLLVSTHASSNGCSMRRRFIDQVVEWALPKSESADEVSCTVKELYDRATVTIASELGESSSRIRFDCSVASGSSKVRRKVGVPHAARVIGAREAAVDEGGEGREEKEKEDGGWQ